MPLHDQEKCAQSARKLWKAGVLKPQSGSTRLKREEQQRKLAEHVQQRLENVRALVQLRTHIEKEKQHVRITRKSLLARLRRGEMTRTDFENELKDAQESLKDYENQWAALRKSGVQ